MPALRSWGSGRLGLNLHFLAAISSGPALQIMRRNPFAWNTADFYRQRRGIEWHGKRLGRIEPKTANKGEHMNKLEIKGDWNIAKGRLKQKFAQLTDNDLRYNRGQEEELLGHLQKLTGET